MFTATMSQHRLLGPNHPASEETGQSKEHQSALIVMQNGFDFDSLPSIEKWVKQQNLKKNLSALNGVLEQINRNRFWLASVINEIQKRVPVGKMSSNIWELSIALIRCLARQVSQHAGKLAFGLFSRLIEEEDNTEFRIASIMYMLVMRASPSTAERLFKRMVERSRRNPELCKPNVSHRVTLISSMIKSGEIDRALQLMWASAPISLFNRLLISFKSPLKADNVLKRMEENLRSSSNGTGTKPTLRSFNIVLKKWASARVWQKAQDVLERAIAWSKVWPLLTPDIDFFVSVVEAYSCTGVGGPSLSVKKVEKLAQMRPKNGFPSQSSSSNQNGKSNNFARLDCQPYRLEFILCRMKKLSIPPTRFCISLLVKSWIEAGQTHEAERVIGEAQESCDVNLCNLVLRSWSFKNVQRAEHFFEWMCEHGLTPDLYSYEILFLAWEKSQYQKKAIHIQYLLRHFKKQLDDGQLCSTRATYEMAMNSLTKTTHKREVLKLWHKVESCKIGDSLLLSTRNLKTCHQAESSMSLVEELFTRMERAYVIPTEVSFQCVISALNSNKKPACMNNKHLEKYNSLPDAESCNLVLAICFSTPSSQAKQSARSMVLHLMREYKSGHLEMRPMAVCFTRLYTSLYDARQKIPTEATISIVEGIAFPDETFASSCFTYALTVCALSRNPSAPLVAHRLWQLLPQPCSRTDLKLVLRTYANHPRHKFSALAETLLLENLKEDFESEEMIGLVIGIAAKQRRPLDAYTLFSRYQHFVSRPNILASVLLACALSSHRHQRWHHFQLAFRVFTKWKECKKAITSLHYLYLLTCAMRLPSTFRTTVVQQVFNQCRDDGLVTESIIRRCQSLRVY